MYFVPLERAPLFEDAMVVAVYGSTLDLAKREARKVALLLRELQSFIGGSLAFLTGGGGGVMKLILEEGKKRHVLVGSNFLENADQNLDQHIDFYQTFQGSARHMRQRWFEVARFHIFCIGGIGTLEEIGMTLTDIKLGLLNYEPIVFFGGLGERKYWHQLRQQLDVISDEGRGPSWLNTNVLCTDDPKEVITFYRNVLQLA